MRHWTLALTLMLVLLAGFTAFHLGGSPRVNTESLSAATGVLGTLGAAAASTADFIDICSQHAPKCPLDEDTWAGEPGAWQYTGKKWKLHSGTPSGRNVIWEWSRPYAGPNPAYADQRENHYSDFTSAPNASPDFAGTGPLTYDWERWELGASNLVFRQYGRPTESESWNIGEYDCESGVYYPVVDDSLAYSYTPMSVVREGQCAGGGYLVAYRAEMWGEPLSETRVRLCDNADTGIPASESVKGNAICKVSPHVGIVYQRYAWGPGPPPVNVPDVGCEAVVYAWGWPKPQQPSSGQEHETWFRNGELRFTRWINLSGQVPEGVPVPDDHAWWDARCEAAFSDTTNVVYTGIYKIGSTVFTDTISPTPTVAGVIPVSGGSLASTIDNTVYTFAPNTFTDTVLITHTIRFQSEFATTGRLVGVNRFFDVAGVYSATGKPAQPTQPYTVTVQYTDMGRGGAMEGTLALYAWDGDQWVRDPSSQVLADGNTIVAMPDSFSLRGVLGETQPVFLPTIVRNN